MSATISSTVVSSPSRDRWFLGTLMRFHVTADDSQGAFSVVEQHLPEGFSPPRHVHANEAGLIYVLEGEVEVEVEGVRRLIHASECAFLPKRVVHTFRARARSRILEVTAPGGVDSFYEENSTPAEREELPPAADVDVPRLVATAKARDIDIVGPPMGLD